MRGKSEKIAEYGLLIALAMILSYVESLVPVSFAVPGVKLGLPNIVIVFALYSLGFKEACFISVIRIVLVSMLFGNFFSLSYSIGGACLSLALMYIMHRTKKFGVVGVSVAGGVAHNAGQILVAIFVTDTLQIGYYFPVLCISGTIAGICIGLVAALIIEKVNKVRNI